MQSLMFHVNKDNSRPTKAIKSLRIILIQLQLRCKELHRTKSIQINEK